ncbi:MAG: hypothetical protein MUF15_03190 [Acidobacteria bacterium]|jgi:hypothetical protein|nr:hypothetical protein [Acidobacteriota bacterium]
MRPRQLSRAGIKKPGCDRRILKRRTPGTLYSRENIPNTQSVEMFASSVSSPKVELHGTPGLFTIEDVRNTNMKFIKDGKFLLTKTGSNSKLINEITVQLNQKINRKSINDAYFTVIETLKNEIL